MKHRKKLLCGLLAGVMTITLMSGCGNKQEDTPKAPERVVFSPSLDTTTEASFTIVGDMNNFEALEAVIAKFGDVYPNVSIAYEKMDDYTNTLAMRLENDPSVGCFLSHKDSESLCEDLTPYEINTDAFSYVIKGAYKEGRLLGIPMAMTVSGLVVNESLLTSLGLSVPGTLAEFTAVCDQLVSLGYTPIQQQTGAVCRYFFEPYVWSRIVEAEDMDALVAVLNSGDPGSMEHMRPVFDLYDSFVEKGYIDPAKNSEIKDNYEAAILNFFEGDVAFMPACGDTVSGMQKRESKSEAFSANPFSYHFIYAPLGEDGVYAEQQMWKSLFVSKYYENKEIVVEFLRFVCSTDSLNLLAKTKGLPTASALPEDSRFANIGDAKGRFIYLWEYNIPYNAWNSVIGRLIEYANGAIATVDEALALIEGDQHPAEG